MNLIPHEINDKYQFIAGWYCDDPLFDRLVEHHKSSPNKIEGRVGPDKIIDKKTKDSIDIPLIQEPIKSEYYRFLQTVVDKYVELYKYCDTNAPWSNHLEEANIQYYKPGGGFYTWHCERSEPSFPACNRHLVYMTYLNDVTDGGETEWYYQKLKVQPRKGLTVIWPADWTFTHRGVPSPTQEKYVLTGWFYYIDKN